MVMLGVVSKKNNDISTVDLLKKYNLFDDKVKGLVWHLNIGKLPSGEIRRVCSIDKDISEDEVARLLHCAIYACEIDSNGFNDFLYQKFVSAGIRYNDQVETISYGGSLKKHTFFPNDDSNYDFYLEQSDDCVFDGSNYEKILVI